MSTRWWCGVVRNGATFANVWLRGFVWHHRNEVFYFSPFFRWGQFYFDRNSFEFLKNCWRKPKPSSKSRLDNLKNTKLRALISVKVFFISGFQLFRSELRNGIRILQELEFLLESCLSPVLDFWKIKLEKSSLTNWIFSLLPNWCLQTKQAAKIKFEIHRLKIQSVELDFSNLIFQKSSTDQQDTPARTLLISGLKSWVLKLSFLSLKIMVKSGLEFTYFEIHRAPLEIPAKLQGQFGHSGQIFFHWRAATLKARSG